MTIIIQGKKDCFIFPINLQPNAISCYWIEKSGRLFIWLLSEMCHSCCLTNFFQYAVSQIQKYVSQNINITLLHKHNEYLK